MDHASNWFHNWFIPSDAAAGKDDVTHLPAYVVAVAAVGGVVAVAIVCATVLIVLRNRRQNTAIAEPRDQADVTA